MVMRVEWLQSPHDDSPQQQYVRSAQLYHPQLEH